MGSPVDENMDTELVASGQRAVDVPDAVVTEVADAIRAMHRVHGVRLIVEVGRLIVERIFDGDSEAIHRRGRKESALSRLADQPDFPFSLSRLSRAVGIYESAADLSDVGSWQNLTLTHVRTVLPLPASERQPLLAKAEQRGWSVKQLALQAQRARTTKTAGGRPPLVPSASAVSACVRSSEDFQKAVSEFESVEGLTDEQKGKVPAVASRVRDVCTEFLERPQRHPERDPLAAVAPPAP